MTNEKLKEKIIKIYNDSCAPAFIRGQKTENGEELISNIDVFLDALIAAGIGDDSDLEIKCEVLQRDVDNLTRTLEEGREEFEEANRRAELANIEAEKIKEIKERFCSMVKSFLKTHVVYKKGMPFDMDFVVRTIWHFVKYDFENLLFYQEVNAELKARLEKAEELPCKVGDTIYAIDGFDPDAEIQELEVEEIRIRRNHAWISAKLKDFDILHNYISMEHGIWWFTDRETAETRLKELRGGYGNVDNGG